MEKGPVGFVVSALNHALKHDKGPDPARLKKRIEKDGVITLSEAKKWYKYGKGLSLKADFSKIDFSKVFPSDFSGNTEKYINLFFKGGKDAAVYGTIKLKYIGNNIVESASGYDIYDFKYDGRLIRDIFMGGVSAYGGPVGLIAGGIYFGIDATIGWDNALMSLDSITTQNRAILGNSWHPMGFGGSKW